VVKIRLGAKTFRRFVHIGYGAHLASRPVGSSRTSAGVKWLRKIGAVSPLAYTPFLGVVLVYLNTKALFTFSIFKNVNYFGSC
jgi:hypothetical protein